MIPLTFISKRTAGYSTVLSIRFLIYQRPGRRSPTFEGNSRQKETIPGACTIFPGYGDRLEQLMRELKHQSHEPAKDGHHDPENFGKPGCGFLCNPKAPQLSCYPRAGVLEHGFPYPLTTAGSYLNYPDGPGYPYARDGTNTEQKVQSPVIFSCNGKKNRAGMRDRAGKYPEVADRAAVFPRRGKQELPVVCYPIPSGERIQKNPEILLRGGHGRSPSCRGSPRGAGPFFRKA